MLRNKNILLGVTGSIAAYKAAFLIRLLTQQGAHVKVVMTDLAKAFITPLTLATLSKNPVLIEFYNPENGDWNNHVDMGIWADAYLIAPATANSMAKMAHGIADNLLLTTYLSARCPVFIAPAMDLDMFKHTATIENLEKLKKRGHIIIEPATGELASGLEGKGRMEEPEIILKTLSDYFAGSNDEKKNSGNKIAGKKVLITAGPTQEALDPVRYIGNRSSGKMGFALANEFGKLGAEVILISGPTNLETPGSNIRRVDIVSASEMYQAVKAIAAECDILVFAAAVADYKPKNTSGQKIKSHEAELEIQLEKTIDIAASIAKTKRTDQFTVGFALETENEEDHARNKLERKKFDMIVLNSLKDDGAGFGYDTNKVTILGKNNKLYKFGLKEKNLVAQDIIQVVAENLK